MEATPAWAAKRVPGSPVAWTATPWPGASAIAGGFGYGDLQLGEGVLVGGGEGSAIEAVGAGFVDFGEVCAFFALLADDGYELVGGVGVVGV